MHRQIEITVSPEHTGPLVDRLLDMEPVITLAVTPGASVKPPGDLILIKSLNKGASDVMRIVGELANATRIIAITSDVTSITDREQEDAIEDDTDDEIWEEVETGLRQSTHVTANYVVLMAVGGIVAACGFVMHDAGQAISLVAASIIAPGFEPLAKITVGVVLGNMPIAKRALISAVSGYAVLFVTAGATYWFMQMAGIVTPAQLASDPDIYSVMANGTAQNLLSLCGALAGAIMVTAHRQEGIAGAMMALELVPATGLAAIGLVCRHGGLFHLGAVRLAIDLVIVLGTAAVFVWLKQRIVHKRAPIV
jgi:hypothetical protein